MTAVSTVGYGGLSQLVLPSQYFKNDSPYNYFRPTPTYALPANITIEHLPELITVNQLSVSKAEKLKIVTSETEDTHTTLGQLCESEIVDLEINGIELIESLVQNQGKVTHLSDMELFSAFEKADGVKAIIRVV